MVSLREEAAAVKRKAESNEKRIFFEGEKGCFKHHHQSGAVTQNIG